MNPSTESVASEATGGGDGHHEETDISSATWLRARIPPLWVEVEIEIKRSLTERFEELHPYCDEGLEEEFRHRFGL